MPSDKPPASPRNALRKRIAVVSRWLHIYLSMASFGVVLFFSATGLTLNHADKLSGKERMDALKPQADHALELLEQLEDQKGKTDFGAVAAAAKIRAHEHGHE